MNRPFDLAWRVLKNQGSPTGLPENFHMDNILPRDDYEWLNNFHRKIGNVLSYDHDDERTRLYDGRTGREMDLTYGYHIPEDGNVDYGNADYFGYYGEDFFIHRDPTTQKNHFIRAEALQEHIEPHQMLSGERINEMLTTDSMEYGPYNHPEELLYEDLERFLPQGYNPQ